MTTSPQFAKRICRPRDAVDQLGRDYPAAWSALDQFRQGRGSPELGSWPDWCYLPMAASYAVVSDGGDMPVDRVRDVARMAALSAWRLTQGIYRFDPAVYDAVRETPVAGDIPHQVLMHLPEWCVYIETPDLMLDASRLHGCWAHLEYDMGSGRAELRLLLDVDEQLVAVPLHLGPWPLAESVRRMLDVASGNSLARGGIAVPAALAAPLRTVAEPIVSLLLYLCSEAAEIGAGRRGPSNPQPTRTKRGWRLFAADRPTTWDVGVRLGAALRRAYAAQASSDGAGAASSVRPHIRRAHWHTFLSGPRADDGGVPISSDARWRQLRWMPPIPVMVDDLGALPAVIRPVREGGSA